MPLELIKAPARLERIVKRRQGVTAEIVEQVKKLRAGEAVRLSAEEYYPGRTPRAIYQALWRTGRKRGVQIAFLYEKEKKKIILTRSNRKLPGKLR